MVWVKIDDRFFHNPKIRQAGQNGREMYLAGLTYCNANLTDGFIPAAEVAYIAGWSQTTAIDSTVDLLVGLKLWEEVDDGYLVHDFLDYNPSKAEVEELRKERAKVGSIGGQRSAEKRWGSKQIGNQIGKQTDNQNGNQSDKQKYKQNSNPVPRSPYPITRCPVPDSPNSHVADSIADEAQAKPEPPQFSEESEPHRLASLLKSLILTNNPTARLRTQTPKQFQAWCAEIDRMLRLDQRTPGNVEGVIRWSQADPFWQTNILSPSKLREKYDQLWLRFTANPKTIPRAASPPIDTSPIVEDPEGRAFIDAQIREQEEWDAKHRKRTTTTASTANRRDGDGILSSLPAMQGRGLDGAEADQRGGPGGHQPPRLGDADEVRLQPLARGTNGQDGPPARIHRLAPRG